MLAWSFVFMLTIIIHTTDSLTYALRLGGLRARRIGLALTVAGMLLLVSRTSNMAQGPLLGGMVDQAKAAIRAGGANVRLELYMHGVLLAATRRDHDRYYLVSDRGTHVGQMDCASGAYRLYSCTGASFNGAQPLEACRLLHEASNRVHAHLAVQGSDPQAPDYPEYDCDRDIYDWSGVSFIRIFPVARSRDGNVDVIRSNQWYGNGAADPAN